MNFFRDFYSFDFTIDKQIELAEIAAPLGVELFVVDDGKLIVVSHIYERKEYTRSCYSWYFF